MLRPLDLVKLTPLMQRTSGVSQIAIGLIDGPINVAHPDFVRTRFKKIPSAISGTCTRHASDACMHGTFVTGILAARRGSSAPAICPDCTFIPRPIFTERTPQHDPMPSATPEELASAIIEVIDAGANIINLSAALAQPMFGVERRLGQALDYAAHRGVLVVAAAGNQGAVSSSAITSHLWVIPVIACDLQGRPTPESNLGSSIGRCGLSAPGEDIVSVGTDTESQTSRGTSAATPFVTGAIALLWSEFPGASANQIKLAVMRAGKPRRRAIAPPLLDAWGAYQAMNGN